MKSVVCKAAVSAALLLASVQAHALTMWGWSFDQQNLGVVSGTDAIDANITVFNLIGSTENLKVTGVGFGGQAAALAGNAWSTEYAGQISNFGMLGYLATVGVAPGESFSFTLGQLTPDANGAAAGDYSTYGTLYAKGGQAVYGKLSWQVAAVPEPEAYALLLAGLAVVGLARRKSA